MMRWRAAALTSGDLAQPPAGVPGGGASEEPRLVARLHAVSDRHGRLPGEVAIVWAVRNPAITGAIVGVRNARQAREITRAVDLRLPDDDIAKVEGAAALAAP